MSVITRTASLADTTFLQPCSSNVVHVDTPAVGLAGLRAADGRTAGVEPFRKANRRETSVSLGLTGGVG
jgi:hypothetical protein